MFVYSLALFPSFIPFLFQLLYFLGFRSLCISFAFIRFASLLLSFALRPFGFRSLCISLAFIRFAALRPLLAFYAGLHRFAPSFAFILSASLLLSFASHPFCFHSLRIPFAFIRFAPSFGFHSHCALFWLSFALRPFGFRSLCTLFWLSFALRPLLAFIRFASLLLAFSRTLLIKKRFGGIFSCFLFWLFTPACLTPLIPKPYPLNPNPQTLTPKP